MSLAEKQIQKWVCFFFALPVLSGANFAIEYNMAKSPLTHLQKIIDHLNSAVLLFSPALNLVYANPAAEDLFRISYKKMLGVKARDLIQCPEEAVEVVFDRAVVRQQPFTERELLLTVSHRTITVNCTVTPIGDSGQILVELLQVDRQLRMTKEEQLIEHNKATREIVRGLAHEINNPLGGIRGAAQLLERELPSSSLREYTQVIIAESDRLSKLLNQLLGPTQIPKSELLNIHQVLERVRSIVIVEAPEGVNIQRDFDPSIPALRGDVDQLIQVFLNIARNALQAVGEKGNIKIKTRVQRQLTIAGIRHRLVIKVDIMDDGPGIESGMLEKIFYPMVTSRSEGTGLGLSIAQSLIHQYQGLIECQSQSGTTVFSVLLPLGI